MDDEPLALVEREVRNCLEVATDDTGRGGLRFGYGWVEPGRPHSVVGSSRRGVDP